VNVDTREVQTTARTLGWDELVFATGSTPFMPPIPGGDAPHVFHFPHPGGYRAIQAIAGPAVVLGGGVLGLRRRQRWRAQVTTSRLFIAVRG
jgi:nitrite reductase (NADH) large subunit